MVDFEVPVAIDVVLLTLKANLLSVLLVRRPDRLDDPHPGKLALPGGTISTSLDENLDDAARRTLKRRTDMEAPYLEQLCTFGDRIRDTRSPHRWSVSIAYYALLPIKELGKRLPGSEILPVQQLPELAFDHNRIVEAAVERVRGKSIYSTLPCFLLPSGFSLVELQRVYECVLGQKLDTATFRRKILEQGIVTPIQGAKSRASGDGRPAQLYRVVNEGLTQFKRTI